jgi:hypothetical protein
MRSALLASVRYLPTLGTLGGLLALHLLTGVVAHDGLQVQRHTFRHGWLIGRIALERRQSARAHLQHAPRLSEWDRGICLSPMPYWVSGVSMKVAE